MQNNSSSHWVVLIYSSLYQSRKMVNVHFCVLYKTVFDFSILIRFYLHTDRGTLDHFPQYPSRIHEGIFEAFEADEKGRATNVKTVHPNIEY